MEKIRLIKDGVFLKNTDKTSEIIESSGKDYKELIPNKEFYKTQTMAYKILENHNTDKSNKDKLKIKFDCLASHDITYVGIIQTARASGMKEFPMPYVLTNCHNSLCAVGGTINEDDHVFGLSAAKKYGGIFVPAHLAVIHTYMREMMSGGGKMILGSDSHTRYGALGTMAIGEGGPELVKQLLGRTYDVDFPEIIAVYLTGNVKPGVGPQDVALKIIGEVFKNGFVKNKVMEFVGDGIKNLPVEFRNGIDVMTTETSCLSSIWATDGEAEKYYEIHGRKDDYKEMKPGDTAYYDGAVVVDLSKIECMIAMPFHPSNIYEINEVNQNLTDIINQVEINAKKQLDNSKLEYKLSNKIINGKFKTDQGGIAGCAGGTFDNICAAYDILKNQSTGNGEFALSVYPGSQPINIEITRNGIAAELLNSGIVMRSAFCGPCFGADGIPANSAFSIRHTTRNFPNREGSKPSNNQVASVALMDARSIAATAVNGGELTAATEIDVDYKKYSYNFDGTVYKNRVYYGYGKADPSLNLKFGPNIADWPAFESLSENIILKVCSVITDEVTTTDELIPSGETSSYRSNPYKLAEFTLSRKDPQYVERAKSVGADSISARSKGENRFRPYEKFGFDINTTSIGSVIFANKPGDGSAREQAASCQKVLGGFANIAREYATKRYRSNLINWGMIPFIYDGEDLPFANDDYIFVPNIRNAIKNKDKSLKSYILRDGSINEIVLQIPELTDDERDIILAGCLINYYKTTLADKYLTFSEESKKLMDEKTVELLIDTFNKVYTDICDFFNNGELRNVVYIADPNYEGIACTADNKIIFNPEWFRKSPWDIDCITHELVHVVQQYGYENNYPSWVCEGLADYGRAKFGLYNEKVGWGIPKIIGSKNKINYKSGYTIAAGFFIWIEKNIDTTFSKNINNTLKSGKYNDNYFLDKTDKTVDELWEMYLYASHAEFFAWIEKNYDIKVPENLNDKIIAGDFNENDNNYFLEKTGKTADELWEMYVNANK